MINVNGVASRVRAAPAPDSLAPDSLWWEARDYICGLNHRPRLLYHGICLARKCTNEEAIWVCNVFHHVRVDYPYPDKTTKYMESVLLPLPDSAYKFFYLCSATQDITTAKKAANLGNQHCIGYFLGDRHPDFPLQRIKKMGDSIVDPYLFYELWRVDSRLEDCLFKAADLGMVNAISVIHGSPDLVAKLKPLRYMKMLVKCLGQMEFAWNAFSNMLKKDDTPQETHLLIGYLTKPYVEQWKHSFRITYGETILKPYQSDIDIAIFNYNANAAAIRATMDAWVCVGRRLQLATNRDIRKLVSQMLWDERTFVVYCSSFSKG